MIEDAIAGASVRNNVLRALKRHGPCTYVQLASDTGTSYDHITHTCYRLRDDGLVEIKTAKSRITGKRMMVVRLRKDTE